MVPSSLDIRCPAPRLDPHSANSIPCLLPPPFRRLLGGGAGDIPARRRQPVSVAWNPTVHWLRRGVRAVSARPPNSPPSVLGDKGTVAHLPPPPPRLFHQQKHTARIATRRLAPLPPKACPLLQRPRTAGEKPSLSTSGGGLAWSKETLPATDGRGHGATLWATSECLTLVGAVLAH